MSFHVVKSLSVNVIIGHIMSFYLIKCYFISYHVILCHIMSYHIMCHWDFSDHLLTKSGGGVKYVFLGLWRQLRSQAEGKNICVKNFWITLYIAYPEL
jgi:hypothetical protein